jgi:TetR/AcrR family transcriptional regulator, cholesterol catabolism regulator
MELELMRVAADLFCEKGYRATTICDLAAAAGISQATFYAYFPSKEEILRRLYYHVLSYAQNALKQAIAEDLSATDKLRRMIRQHINLAISHRALVQVFYTQEHNLPRDMRALVKKKVQAYNKMAEQVLAEGIKRGVFLPLPPKLLLHAVLGTCNWLYQWYHPGGRWTPDTITEAFIRVLESGYLCPEPKSGSDALLTEVQALRDEVGQLRSMLLTYTGGPSLGSRERIPRAHKVREASGTKARRFLTTE